MGIRASSDDTARNRRYGADRANATAVSGADGGSTTTRAAAISGALAWSPHDRLDGERITSRSKGRRMYHFLSGQLVADHHLRARETALRAGLVRAAAARRRAARVVVAQAGRAGTPPVVPVAGPTATVVPRPSGLE